MKREGCDLCRIVREGKPAKPGAPVRGLFSAAKCCGQHIRCLWIPGIDRAKNEHFGKQPCGIFEGERENWKWEPSRGGRGEKVTPVVWFTERYELLKRK